MPDAIAMLAALGADTERVGEIVNLGLRFRSGRLFVCTRHRGASNVFGNITSIIMYAQRFTRFSDSRWCTLGRCCRTIVFASMLGLRELAEAVFGDPAAGDYRLRGFKKIVRPRVRHFMAATAMCSHICDTLLSEFMEDGRVLLHFEEYRRLAAREMDGLLAMPALAWDQLALFCNTISGPELRSDVMYRASISLGFIETQVWSRLQAWPWKLAIGDIDANIAALAGLAEPPEDSVARKIWSLCREGFPRSQLHAGIALLRHVGWSSATVEQQHASASVIHRQHKQYGMAMICCRALLHTARLFFSQPRGDTAEEKLALRAQRLLARRPSGFGPWQMYFKKVMDRIVAKSALAAAPSTASSGGAKKNVSRPEALRAMQRAARGYTALPPHLQEWLQQEAREEQEKRALLVERQLHDAIADLEAERLRQREKREQGHPPKLAFSVCSYTTRQKHELDELVGGQSRLGATRVVQLRKAGMTAPKPLSKEKAGDYSNQALVVAAQAERPWWLPYLCACRKAFRGAAIRIGEDDNAKYFKFLYAKQKPLGAAFLPLRLLESEHTQLIDYSADLGEIFELPHSWEYRFACDYMDVVQAHTMDSDTNSSLAVLPGLYADRSQSQVVTDGPPVWFNEFIHSLPELHKGKSAEPTSGRLRCQRQRRIAGPLLKTLSPSIHGLGRSILLPRSAKSMMALPAVTTPIAMTPMIRHRVAAQARTVSPRMLQCLMSSLSFRLRGTSGMQTMVIREWTISAADC